MTDKPSVHVFEWEAMNATFFAKICHEEGNYARQGAHEAFKELNRIEEEFSRFIEYSYISQLNRAPAGQPVRVSRDVFFCLSLSEILAEATNGMFRVTWKSSPEAGIFPLELDPEQLTVTKTHEDVSVDLGGIGKGFGLDVMREVLYDWDLDSALLIGGGSSLLALDPPAGKPGWEVNLSAYGGDRRHNLSHHALSGSGLSVKGAHIEDPDTGEAPSSNKQAWSFSANAAESDALSTAFLILEEDSIAQVCERSPKIGAVLCYDSQDGPVWRNFGAPVQEID